MSDLKPYVYTAAEELLHLDGREVAPVQQAVYQCPRCFTSMQIDPSAKPVAQEGGSDE